MPAKGGASGKLGDKYEVLWTVDAALRVIGGGAEQVTYESLDPEMSRGVEFIVESTRKDIEYWSVKRQTATGTGWTLATLTRKDEHGRSILGDLADHVARDSRHVAVFASMLGAPKLEEMRSVAASPETLERRLSQSTDLQRDHDKYLLPLFGDDIARARHFLTRIQIRTADETSLRIHIESTIALLFYSESGESIEAGTVRRLLEEYLVDHMHQKIDRKALLDHLAASGFRRKDWKLDATTREKVEALCEAYARPIREQLIGGVLHKLPGTDTLLGTDGLPIALRTLISGGAGGGKSSELSHVVKRLWAAGVPVLPIRMDLIDEGVLTPQRLGEELSLPASPVAVLAGIADGGVSVLVIDQLDAVSLASGRRTEVWSLFERLLAEADGYPNLRVIVACRAFDLEHDHRMRSLKAQRSAFEVVTIKSFDLKTVDEILGNRKVHPKLRPLLVVPLHLAMFLSLERGASEGLETRDQLFAAFWTQKQRRCTQRMGRPCDFAGIMDWLTRWLSVHQELSAPINMLPDQLREDADALASEHVIVLADGRYRFFHEAFFDYAFARRFAQSEGHLIDLLLSGEQHLFRRAQVRQVLSFLRSSDSARYVTELASVLADDRVRFHIKRVVFQSLSAMAVPSQGELTVLRELEAAHPELTGHVDRVISNHVGWFDRLDAEGFLASGLSSGDAKREERIVWLCAMPEILQSRSPRVAALLLEHRRDGDVWRGYLRHVCRTGNVFHSRELFDLFLSLIRDGTLDGVHPGFAMNDNWWSTLYSMSDEAPAMAAEAIGTWLDRKLKEWDQKQLTQFPGDQQRQSGDDEDQEHDMEAHARATHFWQYLNQDGDEHGVITKATEAYLAFVEQLLPRVAAYLAKHAKPCRDRLEIDPLWSSRSFGDDQHQTHALLFKSLARALERLARSEPQELDRLLDPYVVRSHDAMAYLVLRAWSAAPATYAERIAYYLVEDPRRLKVGYLAWSGEGVGAGMPEGYRSIQAVLAASPSCSLEAFVALEGVIVGLRDKWESQNPEWRGLRQLQLLSAMDQSRLGPVGRAKLAELRAKFPDTTQEPPKPMEVVCVGSPIPEAAQERMSDDQWISAMVKYAGVDRGRDRDLGTSGGEFQLAQSLGSRTKANPRRFVALAKGMPADLSASYFNAIIQGISETRPSDQTSGDGVALTDVVALIERAHTLQGRPCGRSITHLIESWSEFGWPASIVEIVAWYATEDPDPIEEVWHKHAPGGRLYYGGDPDMAGLNSTRGSAANSIAALLFAGCVLTECLINAVDRLAHDPSIAVRSQAVRALLALLNTRPDLAIPWFIDCVSVDAVLLSTRHVEHFVHYAGHRDYVAIRPVLEAMIASDDVQTVEVGARLCCLLALDIDAANDDAERVRSGTAAMRESAATIYATNVANMQVGPRCRDLLLPFFADPADSVQAKAATAFRHIAELETAHQAKLLGAFLDAKPNATALEPVIRALEDSPVPLPDLVCRLVEAGIEQFKNDASDIRRRGVMAARDLSKLVIRLYTQSEDPAIKTRCLNAIDAMEQANFYGLGDELGRIER